MAVVMGITASMKSSWRAAAALFVLLHMAPSSVIGAELGGGATVGAYRTDNVFLDTAPNEIDDIAYRVSPWIDFSHESPGLDARLNYRYDWYRYADLDTEQSYHSGRAQLTGKAWQDSLTLVLGASRRQVLSDPNDVIPGGRLPFSGNLTDRDEYWISPRLQRRLGAAASLDMSYRLSVGEYGDSVVQNDKSQDASFRLDNYSAGQGLTWALRYNWRRTEYDISPPWEHQRATAELGFWINSSLRLFAAGGKESAWDRPLDPSLADPFWEAGFAYIAGENLSAEFAAGERSFGPSWRGNLQYQFRRGSTSLSYSESPTTIGFSRSNRVPEFEEPENPIDPDNLDDFLNQPGSAERYISQRLQWNFDLDFRRTHFTFSLFDEDRTGRIRAGGAPLPDQKQTGMRANFSWQAGARTEFSASGSLVDRESSDTNKSRFVGGGLSVNYEIGAYSSLGLAYNYSEQQPRGEFSTSRDYVANVISLLFTITM